MVPDGSTGGSHEHAGSVGLPRDRDLAQDRAQRRARVHATMTALVLGLVTASAKSSYDAVAAAVKNTAIDVLELDRVLARHGSARACVAGACDQDPNRFLRACHEKKAPAGSRRERRNVRTWRRPAPKPSNLEERALGRFHLRSCQLASGDAGLLEHRRPEAGLRGPPDSR